MLADPPHNHSIESAVSPAGYSIADRRAASAKIDAKSLGDDDLLERLTDRVYQLLQADLDLQRERISNYHQPRW